MACVPPSTWPSAPHRTTPLPFLFPPKKFPSLKPLHASSTDDPINLAFAKPNPYNKKPTTSNPNPTDDPISNTGDSGAPEAPDSIKLAMERARNYKNNKGISNSVLEQNLDPNPADGDEGGGDSGGRKVPASIKLAMERARKYKENKGISNSVLEQNLDPNPADGDKGSGDSGGREVPAMIKLAMERARKYKENKGKPNVAMDEMRNSVMEQKMDSNLADGDEGNGEPGSREVPDSGKISMERAPEYKKNKENRNVLIEETRNSGQEKMNLTNSREGIIEKKVSRKEELKISSTDFIGFGFSDKKWYRGAPPGLVPVVETLSEGDLQEVEFIVGDASKFDVTTPSETSSDKDNDGAELYKPKVSTWGVFPRPSNISKTFGGGRVIRPGEVTEAAKDKAAKDKRTRELIAAYNSKMGLTIDSKTKAECEKALKEGDELMDLGKLREALPFYEKIMKDLVFQSELHGLAALQWSICQDSLSRQNEARSMYEKLQSHPNVQVSKKARQFVFSFQAMEMLKVRSSSYPERTGYEDYFKAFVENKANYTPIEEEQDEDALRQGLPYMMLLLSPILIVFLIVARKSFRF